MSRIRAGECFDRFFCPRTPKNPVTEANKFVHHCAAKAPSNSRNNNGQRLEFGLLHGLVSKGRGPRNQFGCSFDSNALVNIASLWRLYLWSRSDPSVFPVHVLSTYARTL